MRILISMLLLLSVIQSPAAINVEEILRNNEEAIGGAKAIAEIETILTVSELSAAGFVGVDTVASMKPDRFVDDADHVQTGNAAGILCRLPADVIEIIGDRDDRIGNRPDPLFGVLP